MKHVRIENEYGVFDLPRYDHQTKVWQTGGHYEKPFVELLLSFLGPDSIAIDVGASLGAHTIAYAQICAHVYAFEPNRNALPFLHKNLEMNGLSNRVTVYEIGLGDCTGNYLLGEALSTTGNVGGTKFKMPLIESEIGRPILRLDDLDLPRADLIKIDVEGMELDVLRGADKYLRECRPILFFECLVHRDSILEYLLFELGYLTIRRHGKNVLAHPECLRSSKELTRILQQSQTSAARDQIQRQDSEYKALSSRTSDRYMGKIKAH